MAFSLNVRHGLAFDAARLETSHATGLLMKLSRNMLVHQIGFAVALEHLLQDESELCMHTGVVHITPNVVTRYTWSHRDIQPWGKSIPTQCPTCFIVQKWTSIWLPSATYLFKCINNMCGWNGKQKVAERYRFEVIWPEGVELLHMKKATGALWMKFVVPI